MSGTTVCAFVNYASSAINPQWPFRWINDPANANSSLLAITPNNTVINSVFPAFGPEGQEALSWKRFKFTKLKLTYTGRDPTDTTGNLWFTYYPDPAISSFDVGYSLFHSTPGSFNVQVWQSDVSVDYSDLLPNYYCYVDFDNFSDSALRLCLAGSIAGYWDSGPSSGSKMYGYLWLEYEILFLEPSDNRNFAGNSLLVADPLTLSEEELKQVERIKAKLKRKIYPAPTEPTDGKIAPSVKRVQDPLPVGRAVAIQPEAVTSPDTVSVDKDRKESLS